MKEITDRWNNELKIGDRIEYVTVWGTAPRFNIGVITSIDISRKYGDIIEVLGDEKNRKGWTYPYRILKIK